MALLDELPFVLPPEMAALYRAAWPSSDLLADVVRAPAAGARVLLLGGAADPLSLVMAQRVTSGDSAVAEDDAAAAQQLARLSEQVRLTTVRAVDPARLGAAAVRGEDTLFDVGLANTMYHPSKHMTLHLLRLGHRLLRPGAPMYVCGAKDRGIVSIIDEMRRLFGNVSVPLMRKGHRVAMSTRGPGPSVDETTWPDPRAGVAEEVTVRGARYLLVPSPLIFAGGQVDSAALMLATAMAVDPGDTVVDLGSGSGIVGLVAARLATPGHVYLLDASHLAVRTAAENAERNAITNVTALAGDGPALMAEGALHPDVVVTNPPFHRGQVEARHEAARFIAAAAARLAPGGRLYLVANRFLAYEPILRGYFAELDEVAGDARYKVLRARGTRETPADA